MLVGKGDLPDLSVEKTRRNDSKKSMDEGNQESRIYYVFV